MFKNPSVFLIFLLIFMIRCNEDEDNNDVFVPTKDWQTVKKGQKIPKGLHVRINLQTGETEAKLLDDDDNQGPQDKTKALSAIPQGVETDDNDAAKTFPKSIIEEAIKNLKNDDSYTPEDIKKIKDEFRSYDEIKKSLKELNLTPKMDAEVISDLLKRHKEAMNAEKFDTSDVLKVLEDLDYLAHQYDNAHEFIKQNGFQEIIYKNLNSTRPIIRKETLKLMAALVQNNVAPKIHALETGSVPILLRLINFDSNSGVKHRALTALGAILRAFPVAQKKFIEIGGLSVLSKFFDSDDIKIQIKLITMISDLVIEHRDAKADEKLVQYYTDFDLTEKILEHDWCKKLNKLLLGLLITDKDDHDSIEKCLIAMHSLKENCGDSYEKELFVSLKKRYQMLSLREDNNDSNYYSVIMDICDELLHNVPTKNIKTEL